MAPPILRQAGLYIKRSWAAYASYSLSKPLTSIAPLIVVSQPRRLSMPASSVDALTLNTAAFPSSEVMERLIVAPPLADEIEVDCT